MTTVLVSPTKGGVPTSGAPTADPPDEEGQPEEDRLGGEEIQLQTYSRLREYLAEHPALEIRLSYLNFCRYLTFLRGELTRMRFECTGLEEPDGDWVEPNSLPDGEDLPLEEADPEAI